MLFAVVMKCNYLREVEVHQPINKVKRKAGDNGGNFDVSSLICAIRKYRNIHKIIHKTISHILLNYNVYKNYK